MKQSVLSVVQLLLSVVLVLAEAQQPDCAELGFSTTTVPTNGANLRYCKLDEEQCCSNSYLEERYNSLSNEISRDVRSELNYQVDSLGEVLDGMEDHLRNVFVPQFSRAFCSSLLTDSECDNAIEHPERSLLDHLHINEDEETDPTVIRDENSGFSSAAVVSDYLYSSITGLRDFYLNSLVDNDIPEEDLRCIHNYSLASPDSERYIYDNLTEIRKSFTSLRRLRYHLSNTSVLDDIVAIPPTSSCIESFINLTCQQCVEDIPDPCLGACNAVVYGCLAPFREGLYDQFELLWSITGQILMITNELLPLSRAVPRLAYSTNISNADAVRTLVQRCGISLSSNSTDMMSSTNNGGGSTAANSSNDELPDSIRRIADRLLEAGPFNDSAESVSCRDYSNDNCWNGTANVTRNNINFADRTVAGQSSNPLANYNTTLLRVFAESFDMFITGFLRSPHFLDVAPEGLILPFNTSNTNGTTDGNNSASSVASVGCFVLLGTLLLEFLLLLN